MEILLYMGMSAVPDVHIVHITYGGVKLFTNMMNSSTLGARYMRSSYQLTWRERIKILSYFTLHKVK